MKSSDFSVVSINGSPRSGTSWLGKIFDSHPDVTYRYQPMFSYRFKNTLTVNSTIGEIEHYLDELYQLDDDDFILQIQQKKRGAHPEYFCKYPRPGYMVMKEVRYHYLIESLLRSLDGIKVVGIVRHPCGVINSWIKTPREFNPEWSANSEWRWAQSKNRGRPEEYYGFEKWKELARLFLRLQDEWSDTFYLASYERLVENTMDEVENMFNFTGLPMHPQVVKFIEASHAREVEDPDTVYRTSDVAMRWCNELEPAIRDTILHELKGTELAQFI